MKILVPVDLSESTEVIVRKICELAKLLKAQVWLLHNAVPERSQIQFTVDPIAARESLAKKFHEEHLQIQELAQRMRDAGVETTALLVHDDTVDVILQEALDVGADMIAVGSHGKGCMYHLLLGSVSEAVLEKSSLPVLVIPTHNRE